MVYMLKLCVLISPHMPQLSTCDTRNAALWLAMGVYEILLQQLSSSHMDLALRRVTSMRVIAEQTSVELGQKKKVKT